MGFLTKLFNWFGKAEARGLAESPEHAVIVAFDYGSADLQPLFECEDRLERAILQAGVGEFDGHEIATDGSTGNFYMYGADAGRLFEVVRPVLEATGFTAGATVTLRSGPPGPAVEQRQVKLSG